MTITIIIVCCWILYRSGKMAAFLEVFRLSPDAAPAATATTAPPEVFRDPPRMKQEPQPAGELAEVPEVIHEEPQEQTLATLDRLQLENDALQILSNKGVANAHIYIKMYSIGDLLDIIKSN